MPNTPVSLETLEALSRQTAQVEPSPIVLESYTFIECKGEDTTTFLQGQLTCDVVELKSQQEDETNYSSLAGCCTPQGRMVGLFFVVKFSPEHIWLVLTKSNCSQVVTHLKKYSIFSKVTLEENPNQQQLLGYIKHQLLSTSTPTPTEGISLFGQTFKLSIKAISTPLDIDTSSIPELYWHLALLLEGLPYFDNTLSGQYMPSDLHFDALGGISYNKGCYTGQEPIARLHFKGTSKFICKVLTWHSKDTPTTPQPDISLNSKKIGQCIQAILLAEHQWVGLVRVRIDATSATPFPDLDIPEWSTNAQLAKIAYNEEGQAE